MKVQELIIDGFKSYATRTVISDWDDSFNCITGLNGSGKSNILDAICFVLGITAVSSMRAASLQDLIYKRGQAGVTKASVTIVFDNSDRSKSPLGFEDQSQISVTRQIVLGGTSKFLINGHRAQQQTVTALFQSVQLNINNPNFLIMQGKITKVLNMKATEILALIEEAAGTRMFEDRREKAVKTMAKKDKKVAEIMDLLQTEIEPKLENLRAEKRDFIEFQRVQSEQERAERLVGAHDYVEHSQRVESLHLRSEALREESQHLEASKERTEHEIASLEEELSSLNRQIIELQGGSDGPNLKELQQQITQLSQHAARIQTSIELKNSSLQELVVRKQASIERDSALQKEAHLRQARFNTLQQTAQEAQESLKSLKGDLASKQELHQSLQTGISSKAGQESGYSFHLSEARTKKASAETSIAKSRVRLGYLENSLNKALADVQNAEAEQSHLQREILELKTKYSKADAQLQAAGWVPGKLQDLQQQHRALLEDVKKLSNAREQEQRRFTALNFQYNTPPSFDPKSVKGLVAELFAISAENYEAAAALQITAGGRLYNVVVDSDTTAQSLIQHGKMRKRFTFIPLNKISPWRIPDNKLAAAKKLAPGKVELALNLIQYKSELEQAMAFIFGGTLVCKDAETANLVAFHPSVKVKCVTLDGDVYDPAGTLSGGSSDKDRGKFLVDLQKYNQMGLILQEKKELLLGLRNQLSRETELADRHKGAKNEIDAMCHNIDILEKKTLTGGAAVIIQTQQERMKEADQLRSDISKYEKTILEQELTIKKIEHDMEEFNSNKDGKLEELQRDITVLEQDVRNLSNKVQDKVEAFASAQTELESIGLDIEAVRGDITSAEEEIRECNAELEALKEEFDQVMIERESATRVFEEEKAKITGLNEELSAIENVKKEKEKAVREVEIKCQQLLHEIQTNSHAVSQETAAIDELTTDYPWIVEAKNQFGVEGTPYAYQSVNIAQHRKVLKMLTDKLQGMKHNVNQQVMNMIENVERKEQALKKMITTIERDKSKITETIETLGEYKRKALIKTWEKVSVDLGKVFGDLLPGSFAKLVPPEGQEVTDGLEVKVQLGGVWKESLVELSGGQRSLVALSLILALLQFKPAPMYILDEIDAALDLHHTQNIGHIIKNRFGGSQFIVVSLKEDMFSNANRVFRARFQDGTSTVTVM